MAVRELDSPFTIANLIQPIEGQNGRILPAVVSGISGSRKRKRSEIVVSSDGEGINVYSIQTPRVVASYAVAPQTSFTCPPCCIYKKPSKGLSGHRYTYASVIPDSSNSVEAQVLCFDEQLRPKALGTIEKHSRKLSNQSSHITAITTIPTLAEDDTERTSHDVLSVYEDGKLDCLSADLAATRWTSKLEDVLPMTQHKEAKRSRVKYSCCISLPSAQRGILHEREDALAVIGDDAEALQTLTLLCLLTDSPHSGGKDGQSLALHLFLVYPTPSDKISSHRQLIRHLATWNFENAPHPSKEEQVYSVQGDPGIFTYISEEGLVTYDLRGASPKRVSTLKSPNDRFGSFLQISSSSLLTSSKQYCGVYDSKYQSLQAILRAQPPGEAQRSEKKRTRGVSRLEMGTIRYIGYFANLKLAIGMTATELVGFPLETALPPRRGKGNDSLLADAINKGSVREDKTGYLQKSLSKKMEKLKTELDSYVTKDDLHSFELRFAQTVGVDRDETAYDEWRKSKNIQTRLLTNGTSGLHANGINGVSNTESAMDTDESPDEDVPIPVWKFPQSFDKHEKFAHQPLAFYALSKLFMWSTQPGQQSHGRMSAIKINFYTPGVFQYLLKTEHLNRHSIQKALQSIAGDPLPSNAIEEGDLISAIVEYDPDLHLLHHTLESGAYLEIGELAQAIKLIIQDLDSRFSLPQINTQLLLEGPTDGTEDGQLDTEINKAIDSLSASIDHAQSTLDTGYLVLSQCLQSALMALHSFARSRTISALRAKLTHHELFFLMYMLRMQLRRGGWLSRYFTDSTDPETSPGTDDDKPTETAILIISHLLSHVLDAIGAGGWLLTGNSHAPQSSEDSPYELIAGLHHDVTSAVEGIYEATYMRGLLTEFLRYGSRVQDMQKRTNKKRGQISLEAEQTNSILPVGLKVSEPRSRMKKDRQGNMQKKSRRQIGMEISKQVPKYSVERISI